MFIEKVFVPQFYSKKSSSPNFIRKKSSSHCWWSRPGYPINFDPSLSGFHRLFLKNRYLGKKRVFYEKWGDNDVGERIFICRIPRCAQKVEFCYQWAAITEKFFWFDYGNMVYFENLGLCWCVYPTMRQ